MKKIEKKRNIIIHSVLWILKLFIKFLPLVLVIFIVFFIYQNYFVSSSPALNLKDKTSSKRINDLELWRFSVREDMNRVKESATEIENIKTTMAQIKSSYQDFEDKLAEYKKNAELYSTNAALWLVSFNQLYGAANRSSAFYTEFLVFTNISKKMPSVLAKLRKIEQISKTGAPSLYQLNVNFHNLQKSIIIEDLKNDKSLFGKIRYGLSSLFLIRRVDSANAEDNSLDNTLNLVEQNLQAGELLSALTLLQDSNIAKTQSGQIIIKQIENRLLINETMEFLQNKVIQTLSTGGM